MKYYSIAKPYITKTEEKAVLGVLRSGNLSLGSKLGEFEERFAKKIGTSYACAVSSGTAGLHLAVLAAGIGPGDEIITTPFSFVSSANCILYVGARPVFVDIDPVTYNIDPHKIEEKITEKTKAILVVHIFGQAADMDPIIRLAKKYKLKIIEDACESISATCKKRNVGTFGESAVFAFYPNKQMTTGEGGMLVTNSKTIYDLCCSLRNQGRSSNMKWLDHERLGYNYRMDEMSAAVGIVQLKKLVFMIRQRQKIARWYSKYLQPYMDIIQPPRIAQSCTHTWFVYVIALRNKNIDRDAMIDHLSRQGIATKPYLPSIHLFSFYQKRLGHRRGDFPVSEMMSQRSLALPLYVGLQEKDIMYIVNKLGKIIKKYGTRIQK